MLLSNNMKKRKTMLKKLKEELECELDRTYDEIRSFASFMEREMRELREQLSEVNCEVIFNYAGYCQQAAAMNARMGKAHGLQRVINDLKIAIKKQKEEEKQE